ncbi:MAG: thioredoxin family protein, partial [Spirochaetia bacterium]|nr:thioredoxin family protein [Spirochaetia bacterium]
SVLAWIWGRWNLPHKSQTSRIFARLAMLFLAGLAVYTAVFAASQKKEAVGMHHTGTSGIPWETYTPERVKTLEKEGKPYFIDFTAAWCLTCQVNKKTSLSSDKVKHTLREKGIVPLLADWTDYNPVISEALAKYGRSGIPVYVFYDGTPGGEGTLLPEVLTEKIVLDAFESVYQKK